MNGNQLGCKRCKRWGERTFQTCERACESVQNGALEELNWKTGAWLLKDKMVRAEAQKEAEASSHGALHFILSTVEKLVKDILRRRVK